MECVGVQRHQIALMRQYTCIGCVTVKPNLMTRPVYEYVRRLVEKERISFEQLKELVHAGDT